MGRRPKSKQRREQQNDPLEALRPLVVLGLLGMILYGAYSIIQKGPREVAQSWQQNGATGQTTSEAPPFVATATNPPTVELGDATAAPAATLAQAQDVQAGTSHPAQVPAIAGASANQSGALTPPIPSAAPTSLNGAPLPDAEENPLSSAPESRPQLPPTYIDAVAAVPPKPADSAISAATSPQAASQDSVAFTAAWDDAHNKLEAGRYAEALAILSVWYDDASLSVEENRQLETLLGQLAGTVIYSTQDMLLPPHIVAPGETLENIARPLNIPWKLLAKINGVGPAGPAPGQAIKVLRGPFDAVVSVSRRRLSLQVGGRYAGTFAVAIGNAFSARTGSSVQFLEMQPASPQPASGAVPVAYQAATHSAITLSDGLRIEPSADPGFVASTPAEQVLLVSLADFADLVDILGPGSQLLVRQ
jgi:LysM repeat protein